MTTLFFDLDGTLLDTQAGIAESIRAALSELGQPDVSDQQLQQCFGPPLRVSFAWMLNTKDKARIAEAVSLFRAHYLDKGIFNYTIYSGVLELLQQLTQLNERAVGLRVLTAKPQQQAEWLLEHAGLAAYFSSIHGSEDQGVKSDKSSHLLSILADASHQSERNWVIGDRASDIHAAKATNSRSVAVHWGYGDHQELVGAESDFHIASPQDLLPLLDL
ncbi:HAD hydrolase-like protein [Pontibacterium granulatum]|uniref:HAD family hydrolase n=1 Tax=Pontibacterium granulatum TaxID=2036029 RepID=UPI002499FE6A|nr:HAD hydrolase-like protein [Pontibacterium granulatum]MDI3324889.1 HAD hydrolase-like protein [Pontibacterium granulatum]